MGLYIPIFFFGTSKRKKLCVNAVRFVVNARKG